MSVRRLVELRRSVGRWLYRGVGRFAHWAHGGEPVWYMHRQWTLEGRCLNWLATLNDRALARENKLWCAMCGKWTSHRSGTCPELSSPNIKVTDAPAAGRSV